MVLLVSALRSGFASLLVALALPACASGALAPPPEAKPPELRHHVMPPPPWEREAAAVAAPLDHQTRAVLIRHAHVLVGDGREIEAGHVLFADGKIREVGPGEGTAPAGARVVDARGRFVTPGLIDVHSHMGVYAQPDSKANDDGNEATEPVASEVRALDAVWAQDPAFERALAGGVTTVQVLPGSADLIGGRAVTLKLRRAVSVRQMRFGGAPEGLKLACGENPKSVYGDRHLNPSTRMGNVADQRAAFVKARRVIDEYRVWRINEGRRRDDLAKAWAKVRAKRKTRRERKLWCMRKGKTAEHRCAEWEREWTRSEIEDPKPDPELLPPARDLGTETLAAAIEGKVLVQVHCYRADDMQRMLALADEFGFKIRAFHHALEAYKIRDELARRGVAIATWADWWGFKLEAYDGIPENVALFDLAGGRAIVHSDSPEGVQRLNQEASKAFWSGKYAGLPVARSHVIRWITENPAWALGVESRVGTLERGKDADVVIWNRDPMSVYASAELVFVDGVQRYNREHRGKHASDFEAAP
jgi:imidazolonepropionase-like amidohydrolase